MSFDIAIITVLTVELQAVLNVLNLKNATENKVANLSFNKPDCNGHKKLRTEQTIAVTNATPNRNQSNGQLHD